MARHDSLRDFFASFHPKVSSYVANTEHCLGPGQHPDAAPTAQVHVQFGRPKGELWKELSRVLQHGRA